MRTKLRATTFLYHGQNIMQKKGGSSEKRRFGAFFGVTPDICALVWNMVQPQKEGVMPFHLLWCVMFLRVAGVESFLSSVAGCDEKTWRKWIWYFVGRISKLRRKVVSFMVRGNILP